MELGPELHLTLTGDPIGIPVLTWVAEPGGDGGEDTWLCSGTSVNYRKCELSAVQTTFQRRDTIYSPNWKLESNWTMSNM